MGARRPAASRPTGLAPSSSSPPVIPDHSAMLATNEIAVAMAAATDPMRMSRCRTCISSWAITASISSGGKDASSPLDAHTTACRGPRPVAKALGWGSGQTATAGIGRSARCARRATVA